MPIIGDGIPWVTVTAISEGHATSSEDGGVGAGEGQAERSRREDAVEEDEE